MTARQPNARGTLTMTCARTGWRLPLLLVLAGGLAACSGDRAESKQPPPRPVVSVAVAPVEQKAMPLQIQAIGTVEAYTVVSVRAQVGGELQRVHVKEGQQVKKGDLLFTIDPRTLRGGRRPGRGQPRPGSGPGAAGARGARARQRPRGPDQGRAGARPGAVQERAGAGRALRRSLQARADRPGAVRPDPHQRRGAGRHRARGRGRRAERRGDRARRPGRHPQRRADRARRRGGGGEHQGPARLHDDPLAGGRARGQPHAERGQRRPRRRHQRLDAAGDQPGAADLRLVHGAAAAAAVDPALHGRRARSGCRRCPPASRGRPPAS